MRRSPYSAQIRGEPVDAAALLVQHCDPAGQPGVLDCSSRRLASGPTVKARAADREEAAHRLDGVLGPLRGDVLEHRQPVLPSLAKKAAAFSRCRAPRRGSGSRTATGAGPRAHQSSNRRPYHIGIDLAGPVAKRLLPRLLSRTYRLGATSRKPPTSPPASSARCRRVPRPPRRAPSSSRRRRTSRTRRRRS